MVQTVPECGTVVVLRLVIRWSERSLVADRSVWIRVERVLVWRYLKSSPLRFEYFGKLLLHVTVVLQVASSLVQSRLPTNRPFDRQRRGIRCLHHDDLWLWRLLQRPIEQVWCRFLIRYFDGLITSRWGLWSLSQNRCNSWRFLGAWDLSVLRDQAWKPESVEADAGTYFLLGSAVVWILDSGVVDCGIWLWQGRAQERLARLVVVRRSSEQRLVLEQLINVFVFPLLVDIKDDWDRRQGLGLRNRLQSAPRHVKDGHLVGLDQ